MVLCVFVCAMFSECPLCHSLGGKECLNRNNNGLCDKSVKTGACGTNKEACSGKKDIISRNAGLSDGLWMSWLQGFMECVGNRREDRERIVHSCALTQQPENHDRVRCHVSQQQSNRGRDDGQQTANVETAPRENQMPINP